MCLATTCRQKITTNTLKFFIKSFSYCCHSLIAFQPGIFPPFPSFHKTRKEEPKKTDGTVHGRTSVDARTKPKLRRRPQETGRSASARTKPKLNRRPQEKGRKKAFPPRQIFRKLHLPVVVRALTVRSCVDSFVGQCDLPRRRPANLSLLICTTVASAA